MHDKWCRTCTFALYMNFILKITSNLIIAITTKLASHAQVPTLKLATTMPFGTTWWCETILIVKLALATYNARCGTKLTFSKFVTAVVPIIVLTSTLNHHRYTLFPFDSIYPTRHSSASLHQWVHYLSQHLCCSKVIMNTCALYLFQLVKALKSFLLFSSQKHLASRASNNHLPNVVHRRWSTPNSSFLTDFNVSLCFRCYSSLHHHARNCLFLSSFNFLDSEGEVFTNLISTKPSTIVITVGKSLTTCMFNYDMKLKACPYLTCSWFLTSMNIILWWNTSLTRYTLAFPSSPSWAN